MAEWGDLDRPPPPQSSQDVSSVSVSTADVGDDDDDDDAVSFFAGSQEWPFVERPRPQPDPDPPDVDGNPIQAESLAESAETPYESQWLSLLDPGNNPAQDALVQAGDDSPFVDPTSYVTTSIDVESQSVSNSMEGDQGNTSLAYGGHQSCSHANTRGGLAQLTSFTYDDDPDLSVSSVGQAQTGAEVGGGGGNEDSNSEHRYV